MVEKNLCLTLSPADAEHVAAHSPQLERSTVVLACFAALREPAVPVMEGKDSVSGAVLLQVEVKVLFLTSLLEYIVYISVKNLNHFSENKLIKPNFYGSPA